MHTIVRVRLQVKMINRILHASDLLRFGDGDRQKHGGRGGEGGDDVREHGGQNINLRREDNPGWKREGVCECCSKSTQEQKKKNDRRTARGLVLKTDGGRRSVPLDRVPGVSRGVRNR